MGNARIVRVVLGEISSNAVEFKERQTRIKIADSAKLKDANGMGHVASVKQGVLPPEISCADCNDLT
jgi:hypothetical protein